MIHKPDPPKSRFELHTAWRREFWLNPYLANETKSIGLFILILNIIFLPKL